MEWTKEQQKVIDFRGGNFWSAQQPVQVKQLS